MTSSTEFQIREAKLADVPAIATLAWEFAQYKRGLGDLTEFRLDAGALERDGFGAEPAFDGLVAEVKGKVAGYLLYHAGYDTDVACRLLVVADLFATQSTRGVGVGVHSKNSIFRLNAPFLIASTSVSSSKRRLLASLAMIPFCDGRHGYLSEWAIPQFDSAQPLWETSARQAYAARR